jgi:hypothetical protein
MWNDGMSQLWIWMFRLINSGKININKQWLIKINGEDNLYYDSENKDYRLRLFCPHCHKPSECQCYRHYDDYLVDYVEGFPVRCCSFLCCLIINSDNETKNIIEAAQNIGISIKDFSDYTEEEAKKIINYLIDEGIWDFLDNSAGAQCRT